VTGEEFLRPHPFEPDPFLKPSIPLDRLGIVTKDFRGKRSRKRLFVAHAKHPNLHRSIRGSMRSCLG
jgi:hypothetical protein